MPTRRRLLFLPGISGLALWAANQGALIAGYLHPPEGYVGTGLPRAQDIAQYFTWINAYRQSGGWLLPDYHAPWITEPALFNPLCWIVAAVSRLTGLDAFWVFHGVDALLYVAAAYAFVFVLRAFTSSRSQFLTALLISIATVPLVSLLALPTALLRHTAPGDVLYRLGLLHFGLTSDGFLHGLTIGFLVLTGTAGTFTSMGLLARYLSTGRRGYLWAAAVSTAGFAFLHPFEVFIVAGAGGLTMLFSSPQALPRKIRDVAVLAGAALAGFGPYALAYFRHPWIRAAGDQSQWEPGNPLWVLAMLGLPTILALFTLLDRGWRATSTDRLLQFWIIGTLIGLYVPWVPWTHHLLDGYLVAPALLLARAYSGSPTARMLRDNNPQLWRAYAAVLLALSLPAHVMYRVDAYRAGSVPENKSSTVAPAEEKEVLSWFRKNAPSSSLLLAPSEQAYWLAVAPIHSFASHWLFSRTYEEQKRLSEAFFLGQLDAEEGESMLSRYGVGYVVVPAGSQARRYLGSARERAQIGKFTIFELSGARMKEFPL